MVTAQELVGVIITASTKKTIKDKVAALVAEDCIELQQYIKLALDPQICFFLTKAQIPKIQSSTNALTSCASVFRMLECLSTRTKTGNAAKAAIKEMLEASDNWVRVLFQWAIEKKLPGNIGRTIANKVWPDMIYKQPYGGCKPYDPEWIDRRFDWDEGVLIEEKIDGMTMMLSKDMHRNPKVHTRAGQDITDQMHWYFRRVFSVMELGTVLHVEAQVLQNGRPIDRAEGNGYFNSIIKGEGKQLRPDQILLTVLDQIDYDGFYKGKDPTPAGVRLNRMISFVEEYEMVTEQPGHVSHHQYVTFPLWQLIHSVPEAMRFAQNMIRGGGEGAVIKDPAAPWESKKMTSQMKVKNEFDCTLQVVGCKPHKVNPDWVGSLICTSEQILHDRQMGLPAIETLVGSGLNEEAGHELDRTQGPDAFIGKLVEVKAECITKNDALQLPRVIEIRHDKTKADTYDEVVRAYRMSVN